MKYSLRQILTLYFVIWSSFSLSPSLPSYSLLIFVSHNDLCCRMRHSTILILLLLIIIIQIECTFRKLIVSVQFHSFAFQKFLFAKSIFRLQSEYASHKPKVNPISCKNTYTHIHMHYFSISELFYFCPTNAPCNRKKK